MLRRIIEEIEWRKIDDEMFGSHDVWVSEDGRLSVDGNLKTGHKNMDGYVSVHINNKTFHLSRLVAKAFIDSELPLRHVVSGKEVDHLYSRDDNAVSAITVCSNHQYNCSSPHSRKNYRKHNKRLTKFYDGLEAINPKTGKVVKTFKGEWEDVAEWIGKPASTVKGNISHAINNKVIKKNHTAYGYEWRHIPKERSNWQEYLRSYRAEYYKNVTKKKRELK